MNEQNSRHFKKGWGNKRGVFFRHEDDSQSSQTSGSPMEKGGANSFIRNNLQHEKMGKSFYQGLAAIFLGFIGTAFYIGFSASDITREEISKVVYEVVPNVKLEPDRPTLRRQMYEFESGINECKRYEKRITDVECYLKKGVGCK